MTDNEKINKKKELIKFCKCYKGEGKNPYSEYVESYNIWRIEKYWLEKLLKENGEEAFMPHIEEYHLRGLDDFKKNDGVPESLKAFLLNRFLQGSEGMCTIEDYKAWYERYRQGKTISEPK